MAILDDLFVGLEPTRNIRRRQLERKARKQEAELRGESVSDGMSFGGMDAEMGFIKTMMDFDRDFVFPPELAELREQVGAAKKRRKMERMARLAMKDERPFVQQLARERFTALRTELDQRKAKKLAKQRNKAKREAFKRSGQIQRQALKGLMEAGKASKPGVKKGQAAVGRAAERAGQAAREGGASVSAFGKRLISDARSRLQEQERLFPREEGESLFVQSMEEKKRNGKDQQGG